MPDIVFMTSDGALRKVPYLPPYQPEMEEEEFRDQVFVKTRFPNPPAKTFRWLAEYPTQADTFGNPEKTRE